MKRFRKKYKKPRRPWDKALGRRKENNDRIWIEKEKGAMES